MAAADDRDIAAISAQLRAEQLTVSGGVLGMGRDSDDDDDGDEDVTMGTLPPAGGFGSELDLPLLAGSAGGSRRASEDQLLHLRQRFGQARIA